MIDCHYLRWLNFCERLSWTRGQLDDSSWAAFNVAALIGVTDSEVKAEVARRIQAAGDTAKDGKLSQQIKRAYARAGITASTTPQGDTRYQPSSPTWAPKAEFNRSKAEAFARQIGDVSEQWFIDRSPEPPDISPENFLEKIFHQGERVIVFSTYASQGQCVWEHGKGLDHFHRGHAHGVWFLNQPVTGQWLELERLQSDTNPAGRTRRAEENCIDWRHFVLESDIDGFGPTWLGILAQLPLSIISITHSGGESYHAFGRCLVRTKADWDKRFRQDLRVRLVELGADLRALTAVRLTRLPNCYHGNRLQQMIYFNPDPKGQPIYGIA
jgi:hypothetical protein